MINGIPSYVNQQTITNGRNNVTNMLLFFFSTWKERNFKHPLRSNLLKGTYPNFHLNKLYTSLVFIGMLNYSLAKDKEKKERTSCWMSWSDVLKGIGIGRIRVIGGYGINVELIRNRRTMKGWW